MRRPTSNQDQPIRAQETQGEGSPRYGITVQALESETAYTLTSNSLLPLLLELQKGDALAIDKSKVREKQKAARVSGK